MVDLIVLILENDRSKFYKLWFRRNDGYKNDALPFGVDWQPQTRRAPQACETFCACYVIQSKMISDYCLS